MRPVKRRQFIQALATVALLPTALAHGRMQERGANMVRLGVTDLSFHHATAAVVALVLQRMGFVVERSSAPPFNAKPFLSVWGSNLLLVP